MCQFCFYTSGMTDFNFHPLLVHFPIALLSIYSLLEFLRFRKILEWLPFTYMKGFLVILGSFFSLVTWFSGQLIEKQFSDQKKLVELHSHFAVMTIVIYGLVAAIYIWKFIELNESIHRAIPLTRIWSQLYLVLNKPLILVSLAFIGFGMLLTTGAMGGMIAFGPNIDPFTQLLYLLLKPYISPQ